MRFARVVDYARLAEIARRSDLDDLRYGKICKHVMPRRKRIRRKPGAIWRCKVRIGDTVFNTAKEAAAALNMNVRALYPAIRKGGLSAYVLAEWVVEETA